MFNSEENKRGSDLRPVDMCLEGSPPARHPDRLQVTLSLHTVRKTKDPSSMFCSPVSFQPCMVIGLPLCSRDLVAPGGLWLSPVLDQWSTLCSHREWLVRRAGANVHRWDFTSRTTTSGQDEASGQQPPVLHHWGRHRPSFKALLAISGV